MHDDLCPCINKGAKRWCECALIAKVRADERERHTVNNPMLLADLRAKVEALLPERPQPQYLSGWDAALADVLDLIDGEVDQ